MHHVIIAQSRRLVISKEVNTTEVTHSLQEIFKKPWMENNVLEVENQYGDSCGKSWSCAASNDQTTLKAVECRLRKAWRSNFCNNSSKSYQCYAWQSENSYQQ